MRSVVVKSTARWAGMDGGRERDGYNGQDFVGCICGPGGTLAGGLNGYGCYQHHPPPP